MNISFLETLNNYLLMEANEYKKHRGKDKVSFNPRYEPSVKLNRRKESAAINKDLGALDRKLTAGRRGQAARDVLRDSGYDLPSIGTMGRKSKTWGRIKGGSKMVALGATGYGMAKGAEYTYNKIQERRNKGIKNKLKRFGRRIVGNG